MLWVQDLAPEKKAEDPVEAIERTEWRDVQGDGIQMSRRHSHGPDYV